MKPIKLRRVATYTTTEVTDYFEFDPEPFKTLLVNEPYCGDTQEEFLAYIQQIEDCDSICEELDAMGYEDLADNLDMLLQSAETEELDAKLINSWTEEF
jgi:hypothetical protein